MKMDRIKEKAAQHPRKNSSEARISRNSDVGDSLGRRERESWNGVLVLPGLQKIRFSSPRNTVNYVVWPPEITFPLGLAALWKQETRPNRKIFSFCLSTTLAENVRSFHIVSLFISCVPLSACPCLSVSHGVSPCLVCVSLCL